MKTILTLALVGAALFCAPLATEARPSGGFHGGGFHGGFRGGFPGGFPGGFYGYPGYYGPSLGIAFGPSLAPWYYGPAYYDYYGVYGPAYPPGPPVYIDPAAPPQVAAAPPSACGQWSWNQAQAKYSWIPGPCAAPPAPPAG